MELRVNVSSARSRFVQDFRRVSIRGRGSFDPMVHQGFKSSVLSTWQRPKIFNHFLFSTVYHRLQFLIRSVLFVLDTNWTRPHSRWKMLGTNWPHNSGVNPVLGQFSISTPGLDPCRQTHLDEIWTVQRKRFPVWFVRRSITAASRLLCWRGL